MRRFLLPTLFLLFATSLYGQDAETVATETRIAKQSSTENGDRGLFTVPTVETLNKNQYSFGYAWSGSNRSPRDVSISSLPAFVSYGVLGKLMVTATLDTNRQVTAHNLAQTGYNSAYPFISQHFTKGYGDTLIAGKYRFRRTRDNIGGLAVKSFVKLGTADATKGLGTGKTDVGADFIFSSLLPLKFALTSDIGYVSVGNAKDPVTGGTRHLKNEVHSGLGTAWPAEGLNLSTGTLQGIFEYSTVSFVGGGTSNAAVSIQNWRDVAVGARFLMLNQGITLHAGYRTNTKIDLHFPGNERRQGFSFSVSYTKPVRPPGKNSYPVVALESSSESIPVGGSAMITATGYDADRDELKYSWSASGGQIVGSGTTVTFNATGIAPGTYTVRVTASDGKGGTATSLIDVVVKQ